MAGLPLHCASSIRETTDRLEMLKAFDGTKVGVKGLVDSGALDKIPEIFIRPAEDLSKELTKKVANIQIPVIDLSGIHDPDGRKQIIEQIRSASETWGFFQVVNHGIPLAVLDGMIEGIRQFNEGDIEEKKKFYSRDYDKTVKFNSSNDLFHSRAANWRDTLHVEFSDQLTAAEEVPECCRDKMITYLKNAMVVRDALFELVSEVLGLEPNYLKNMECTKRNIFRCHYYPPCPDPDLTMGTSMHSDPVFLTFVLQNHISGLQVLYQDQWVNVEPVRGALVVNIGDFLQLMSNGKLKSCKHRVVSRKIGPRISAAFFTSGLLDASFSPIKELLSEDNPAKYKEVNINDYMIRYLGVPLEESDATLDNYKI